MNVSETNDPLELENFDNPWSVSDLAEFLKYCCPECDFKDINVQVFSNHAKISHENASTFFQNENTIEKVSSFTEEETKYSLSESFKETQSELESTFKIELPDETIEDVELQLDDSYVESNYEGDMDVVDNSNDGKVEKILKGSLESITSFSPSVKIQIMGRKVYLRCKEKHCWALSTNLWKQKVF